MTTELMEMNFNSQLRSRCSSTLNVTVITGIYPPRLQMELLKLFIHAEETSLTWISKGCLSHVYLLCLHVGGAKQAQTFTVHSQKSGACATLIS